MAVIGAALMAKLRGAGRYAIAAALDTSEWMVASWVRRFAERAAKLRQHFSAWLALLDPAHPPIVPSGSEFADALEVIGMVGIVAVRRFGPKDVWSLASALTEGGLIATRDHQYRQSY